MFQICSGNISGRSDNRQKSSDHKIMMSKEGGKVWSGKLQNDLLVVDNEDMDIKVIRVEAVVSKGLSSPTTKSM